jgi:hypothetical protein
MVKVVRTDKHVGISESRNFGVRSLSSEVRMQYMVALRHIGSITEAA